MGKAAKISGIASVFTLIMVIILLANLMGALNPPKETGKNLTELNESGNNLITICMASENIGSDQCNDSMNRIRDPCQQWPDLDRCSDNRIEQYWAAVNSGAVPTGITEPEQTSSVTPTQSATSRPDNYRCFSGMTEIRNVKETSTGNEWESVQVWHERPESFCDDDGSLGGSFIDLTRLNAYAFEYGKPRYTEFKLINGTTITLNEDYPIKYSS